MKITTEYTDNQSDVIDVISAEYIGEFVIQLLFNDGIVRQVDFKPFLKKSLHPIVRTYQNETKFKQYKIIDGNLNWNDYEMIFPVYDLYKGKI
jgi:hypothetical protein